MAITIPLVSPLSSSKWEAAGMNLMLLFSQYQVALHSITNREVFKGYYNAGMPDLN